MSPLWDHDFEPPLCAAVRLGCPALVVGLLLEHGADATAEDIHDRTPLAILRASPGDVRRLERPPHERLVVEELLLEALSPRDRSMCVDPDYSATIPAPDFADNLGIFCAALSRVEPRLGSPSPSVPRSRQGSKPSR